MISNLTHSVIYAAYSETLVPFTMDLARFLAKQNIQTFLYSMGNGGEWRLAVPDRDYDLAHALYMQFTLDYKWD
jgi:hypothetical protein